MRGYRRALRWRGEKWTERGPRGIGSMWARRWGRGEGLRDDKPASARWRGAALAALALAALTLGMLPVPAAAEPADALLEGLDVSPITQWSQEQNIGVDVGALLSQLARGEAEWDFEGTLKKVGELALSMAREALGWMARLAAPALLWAALGSLWPGSAARAVQLPCALAVAAQLAGLYQACASTAQGALSAMAGLCRALYPVLGALLAAGGKGAGAAMFTPAAALAGTITAAGLEKWAIGLASVAAALTLAGHLSQEARLDGLAGLARRACAFLLGGAMTAFAGVMTVQGILSRGYDGASLQTARFAVGSLLPIVGGEVADSLDALVTSAALVKNAVGVAGLVLLLALCARPVIYLALMGLAVRLAGAVVEILAWGAPQKMLARSADVVSLLLAAVAAGAVLAIILVGGALTLFGGG